MSKEHIKISANEINRYVYCPYQWYYKRTYGAKELNQKYKQLNIKHSNHEHLYKKGMNYHKQYHRKYQNERILKIIGTILVIAFIIGAVV